MCLYIAFNALPAHAAVQDNRAWLTLIQSLEDKGVERIGDFDLEAFRKKAMKVPFLPYTKLPPSVLAGSRESAFYLTYQKRVYILPDQPKADLASLPQLEVHELLGALSYGDADTSKSTALVAIDQTADPHARTKLVQLYGASLFKTGGLEARAGGFSVGGGGDLSTIHVKAEVLDYVRKAASGNPGMVTSDFFKRFPSIAFEPMRKGSNVALNYKYQGKGKSYHESFSVFVPMARWAGSEEDRTALVEEIAAKLLSIFPVEGGQATRTFTPSDCPAGKRITFPAPSDSYVADLQDRRGGMILGCDTDPASRGGETTTGISGDAELPKTPGLFEYACTFSYPTMARPYEITLHSSAGMNMSLSTDFSVDEGDYIGGFLNVDASGRALLAALAYTSPKGARAPIVKQKASDSAHARASIEVDGQELTFSCERQ